MKKNSLILLSFIFFLIGCAEKPKNVGDSLIDPNDVFAIADTVITSMSDMTYRVVYANGFGNTNLTGRLQNN
ncbi:MAG TPA: hypothetical protein DCQ28_10665, partial [Bacteroidetes bacterium]|nr:hypothetical protein [Bacteroidota bacterium]